MASKTQGAVIAPFAAEKAAIIGSVTLDNLRIIKVHDVLKLYQLNTNTAKHFFCLNCEIYPITNVVRTRPNTAITPVA